MAESSTRGSQFKSATGHDKPPRPGDPEWESYWDRLGGREARPAETVANQAYPTGRERPPGTPPGVVGLAVLIVVVLAGGGAGLWWVARDSGVSKAEFIEKAEELCRPANAPVTALVKPTSYAELEAASGTVVTATNSQLTQLGALKRPAGAAGREAEAVLEAMGGTSAAARQLQTAATALDDGSTIAATKGMSAAFAKTAGLADTYGFTACGTGMQPGINAVVGGSNAVLKAGFVAKADSLCRAGANAFDAIPEPRNNSLSELTRYMNATLATMDKLLSDLKALTVPPADELAVRDILAAQEKVDDKAKEMRDAALRGDVTTVTAADRQMGPLTSAADAKWDAYGLTVCGSNFGL